MMPAPQDTRPCKTAQAAINGSYPNIICSAELFRFHYFNFRTRVTAGGNDDAALDMMSIKIILHAIGQMLRFLF